MYNVPGTDVGDMAVNKHNFSVLTQSLQSDWIETDNEETLKYMKCQMRVSAKKKASQGSLS